MDKQPISCSGALGSVHAATVAAMDGGELMAAWFAGTHEGAPDVAIYTALWRDGAWSAPMLALRVP
jgi:predicted neuraminidase